MRQTNVVSDQLRQNAAKNVVGAAVRRLRQARNLSQEELSAKVSVQGVALSRSSINKIEAGTRSVFDFQVEALALALKVPIAELYLRPR